MRKLNYENSLGYKYPEIAKMIAIPENNISMEDTFKIACKSGKYFYFKCPICNEISQDKKQLRNIIDANNYSCWNCSDGFSFPNKILRQISKQLNLNWQFEYSEPWMNGCRFDAYDPVLKQPIEMDAVYKNNHIGERKKIDEWKDTKAIEHKMKPTIRINLMDNYKYNNDKFNYIQKQIILALGDIYDLDSINWEKLFIDSQASCVIKVKELLELGWRNKDISEELNIAEITVAKYKKDLGIKNQYELAEEKRLEIANLYLKGYSITEIAKDMNVNRNTITRACKKMNIKTDFEKNKEKRNEIIKLVKEGYSLKEICTILNTSRRTIGRVCEEENLKIIHEKDKRLLEIKKLLKQNLTIKEISNQLNISEATVRRYRKKIESEECCEN